MNNYFYIRLVAVLMLLSAKGRAQNIDRKLNEVKPSILHINVLYKEAKLGDTLVLTLSNMMNSKNNITFFKTVNSEGFFKFDVPVTDSVGYWQLSKIERNWFTSGMYIYRPLTVPLFWERGDSVTLALSNEYAQFVRSDYLFTGIGSEKYNAWVKVFNHFLSSTIPRDKLLMAYPSFNDQFEYVRPIGEFTKLQLKIASENKAGLSDLSYEVLKADILCDGDDSYLRVKKFYEQNVSGLDETKKELFRANYFKTFGNVPVDGVSLLGLSKSLNALRYLNSKFQANAFVLKGSASSLDVYNQIKEHTTGELRERMILYCLMANRNTSSSDSLYRDAVSLFHSSNGRMELKNIEFRFVKNATLKEHSLLDIKGKPTKISNYKGKVVMLDFWFTGCGGCALYFKNVLSKVEEMYRGDPQVAFISVSADKKHEEWLNGINSGNYTSTSTINLNTAGFEHPMLKENKISAFPTAILLGKDGKVRYFKTENLYAEAGLIAAINDAKNQ